MAFVLNSNIAFDDPGLGWRLFSKGSNKLLFAGTILGIDDQSLLHFLQSATPNLDSIHAMVRQFKGHFGIVYQDDHKTLAVTDCIASYPIFYRSFDHVCNIATSPSALGPDCTIDKSQAKAITLSGYTVGCGTVFQEISSLGHGKVFSRMTIKKIYYINLLQV